MTAHDPVADGAEPVGVAPAGVAGADSEQVEPQRSVPEEVVPQSASPEQVEPREAVPAQAPLVIKRRGRRVSTEPAPGYIGEPAREQHQSSENDQRLKGDVPPHWG
ncbi:hypothetical protein [Agrococcus beijingensis]|uniref:hypothetical protein n=1 Tax=Agrococcus beijingensis TaxID=3068634 RepID=UPI0027411131|nr:hypothetical protein [Agrococcus sp. REN33]